ncbi:MAG: energy-coupling factor transporter transmembrane component T, partial [Oscillospiraceae bacterium]
GLVAAGMMVACMLWFFCYNEVVTSDKFLDIFGRIVPTAALIASMTLRLIPKLVGQIKTIADSQSTMGLTVTSGSLWHRAKSCARILSILVTWALEDAVITSDSMHARGYGSRKRTHFTPFVFCRRDLRMLALIGALALLSLAAYVLRIGRMLYYPVLNGLRYDGVAIVCYAAFLLLGLLPVIITAREDAKWKFLELKR